MALAAGETTAIGEKGRQILDSEGYKRGGEARFEGGGEPRTGPMGRLRKLVLFQGVGDALFLGEFERDRFLGSSVCKCSWEEFCEQAIMVERSFVALL